MSVHVPAMEPDGGGAEIAGLYRSLSKRLEQIVRIDVLQAPDPVIEDACQFAWGRLVHHRERVRRESALPWLARTAIHEAFKLLRRERRSMSLEQTLELSGEAGLGPGSLGPSSLGPDELAECHEKLEALRDLPERQQRLVWLHALGLSYAEIALQTGDSVRTVERQLLRAKRALRAAAAD